jgi:adenosylcobinamide-GDP ribazoletransferase
MRTPDVGAFGVCTVAIVVVLQAAALASRSASVLLLAAIWCAARAVVAAVPARLPYARDAGIATPLLAGARAWPALAVLPAVAVATVADGIAGGAAVAAAVLAVVGTIAFAMRRIGGFTGDVLGAAIVLAETAGLVVAAATLTTVRPACWSIARWASRPRRCTRSPRSAT